ncbi:DUF3552 domain-containing protein, partial [Candidatus Bipolaricaulota bacterium]|nr:DUF3552 domain-containing protein [Candidatus Bipolaricaulota bacterium]
MTSVSLYTYIGLGMSLVAAIAIGFLLGGIPRRRKEEKILSAAREEADQLKKAELLEARQQIQEMREEAEERAKRREEEMSRAEERILQREDRLGKKSTYLEKIEDTLREDEEELVKLKEEGVRLLEEGKAQLERIAGWTQQDARDQLLKVVEADSQRFFSRRIE